MNRRKIFATLAAGLVLANTPPEPAHDGEQADPSHISPTAAVAPLIPLTSARLPGFASILAERPLADGPAVWDHIHPDAALDRLATAPRGARQAARWDYALAALANKGAPEAIGVLDTMMADDPDMALVPAFRRARGSALVRLRRGADALAMLTDPMLATNAEACMWRMMARMEMDHPAAAFAEIRCAIPAINQRKLGEAGMFIRAASKAAIHQHRYRAALDWLKQFRDGDPAANLLRGEAMMGLGDMPGGRLRFNRTMANGTPEQRIRAQLALVENLSVHEQMPATEAIQRAERILFLWRGGDIEQRALVLGYDLAAAQQDDAAALHFGGMLLRYGETGARGGEILAASQQRLFTILDNVHLMPLPEAAGLFWENRDLAPTGPDGDRLLARLAERLAGAGLYERAADLLVYQMRDRAKDIEKGPVSEKVARYYLLAGFPGRALLALRASDQPAYPPAILDGRQRMEALALFQLGKTDEALAMLIDIEGMEELRSEILWRRRDWQGLVASLGGLPKPGSLSAVGQALILRHAVALAMTGNEKGLDDLRARYGSAFARLPSRAAFDLLTGPVSEMTSDGIARAMAAIPSASVAREYGDILDSRRKSGDNDVPAPVPSEPRLAATGVAKPHK